jgi:hypothetical protein
MSRRTLAPEIKIPSIIDIDTEKKMSALAKWVPLICAGAAVGVSVIALKEIKNVRKEMLLLKKEQMSSTDSGLSKRIEMMEKQLNIMNEYLKNQSGGKCEPIIKNAVKNEEINVINDEEEYEEVEVTDEDEPEEEQQSEEIIPKKVQVNKE